MKRFLLLLLCLSIPMLVSAQDEASDTEDIAYLRLNSNFSVPELPNWENTIEGETVLFTRDDIAAQIYVRIVDTLDTDLAIDAALADLSEVTVEANTPIYEGRIGRNDGTWNYKLFSDGDTSITAYALLKSNQVYVVLFAETSADYDAYHLAIRSTINEPNPEELENTIQLAANEALQNATDTETDFTASTTRNPVEANPAWIEAEYDDNLMTASYLFNGIIYVTLVDGNLDSIAQLSNDFDSVFLGFVITPDNSEFLYLGSAFSAVIMLALLGSMVLRHRNLQKDLQMIEQLAEE